LKRLHGVKLFDRKAYLEACLCFYNPQTNDTVFESEKILGSITETTTLKIIPGFPYRAILIVDKFKKYYDELTEEEHHQINHRLIALKRLVNKISNF
ncbi:MAG: non-canonical purine NTP pyrophosphatase, partial [Patescibacteria group bacterium]